MGIFFGLPLAGTTRGIKAFREYYAKAPRYGSKLKSSAHRQTSREPTMNYVELIQHQAERVFGNKNKADTWLNQPKAILGGKTPLQVAHTETGYDLVKAELEKLSHGFTC
ncbi:antitoxin Xre/MbcA/ParS toxin-binding domain-containing protein [Pseudomonas sp. MDT1-16]